MTNDTSSIFEFIGNMRLEDRQYLTAVKNELLEAMVMQRMVLPQRQDGSTARPKLASQPLPLDQVYARLEAAAPLNWQTFLRCLDVGTESYETLPEASCSTERHPQARLFRSFLWPYLRGNVLDIGCGPQRLPFYLQNYPVERICGIDPISSAEDHDFTFVSGMGEILPWEDNSFDVVISATTLDHFFLLDRGMEEVHRVLRPNGHFVAWITEFEGAPAYDPYAAPVQAYDSEHVFHIDRAWYLPFMEKIGFYKSEIIHFDLPFNYLFMSFEKPGA